MVLIKKIRKIVQRVVYYDMREEDIKKIEDTIYNITEGKWYIKDDKVLVFLPEISLEPILIADFSTSEVDIKNNINFLLCAKDNFVNLIVNRLKTNKNAYDVENEKNKKIIDELKQIEKEKFKLSMIEYKKKAIENKNSSIKLMIIKPTINKIKIEKVKNPRKPNRKTIVKPVPDETLKSEIKYFCSNLKSARTNLFNNNIKDFSI